MGDFLYKVALKAILITSFKFDMLLPNQLGVNSPRGVEPTIFLLQDAIAGANPLKIKNIASLDLTNAFNQMDRTTIASAISQYAPTFYKAAKWAYNQPSLLITSTSDILASASGVR